MRFAKAHGLGNDFILVRAADLEGDLSAKARSLCHRHTGIGGDGLVVYELDGAGAVTMRLFNADGSDGDVSANGLRCLGAYLVWRGEVAPRHTVYTPPGPRALSVEPVAGCRFRARTDLGSAILSSAQIPVSLEPPRDRVIDHELPVEPVGRTVRVTATSLGNPHCAVFVDEPPDDRDLAALGSALEVHPFFPRRTNVELVVVKSRDELRVRFWERGVGHTSASGTGAASAAVAAILTGRTDRRLRVVCDGGVLEVEWPEGDNVFQTGVAEILFEGDWRG